MLGIVLKTIVEFLVQTGGEALRLRVMEKAGFDRDHVWRIDRSYPDSDFSALKDAALLVTELEPEAFYEGLARTQLTLVRGLFPELMNMSTKASDLLALQVRLFTLVTVALSEKTSSAARPPHVQLDQQGPHDQLLSVTAPVGLCRFFEALIHVAAEEFGDRADVLPEQCQCDTVLSGGTPRPRCRYRIRWREIAGRQIPATSVSSNSGPQNP